MREIAQLSMQEPNQGECLMMVTPPVVFTAGEAPKVSMDLEKLPVTGGV